LGAPSEIIFKGCLHNQSIVVLPSSHDFAVTSAIIKEGVLYKELLLLLHVAAPAHIVRDPALMSPALLIGHVEAPPK
jgi:hypothetical protein